MWHHKTDNTNLWKCVPVGCIRYRYLSSCTVSRLELVQLLTIWFIEHIGINVYSTRRLSNFLNYSAKGHQILFALYLPTTTYVHNYIPTYFFFRKKQSPSLSFSFSRYLSVCFYPSPTISLFLPLLSHLSNLCFYSSLKFAFNILFMYLQIYFFSLVFRYFIR